MAFYELAPNVTVVPEVGLNVDGVYEIGPNQRTVLPFTLSVDQAIRIKIEQIGYRQSYSIRAWISNVPNGMELAGHWHPGTGGIFHKVYDKNLVPAPVPEVFKTERSQYSGISFDISETLIPLEPRLYYYNVWNMENQDNGFRINLIDPDC